MTDPLLEVTGLTVAYGRVEAVRGVSFDAAPGSLVSLVGANGAGKSSIINAVSGIIRPRGGTILFEGRDITRTPAHRLVEQAGFAVDKRGRAWVDDHLQARGYEGVYLAGDAAAFPGDDGRPLPPTAQVALQQGEYLGRALARRLRGLPVEPFRPRVLGTVISLGRRDGVGLLGRGYRVTGRAARVLKSATLWRYLYRIGGARLLMRVLGGAPLQPLPGRPEP